MKAIEKPKICVPVRADSVSLARKYLVELAQNPKVDLAEVWLDKIKDLNVKGLLLDKPLPVVAAVKYPKDHGSFHGQDSLMFNMLKESAQHGADYLAAPVQLGDRLLDSLLDIVREMRYKKMNTQLIIEDHNWTETPSLDELKDKANYMAVQGADVVKIAVTPKSEQDVAKILMLALYLQRQQIRHILIAMGKMGTTTRVLTPLYGGEFMFAPLKIKWATANGQLNVDQLSAAWDRLL